MKNTLPDTSELNKVIGSFSDDNTDVVFAHDLSDIGTDQYADYAIHVLCHQGTCNFKMSGNSFRIKAGNLVIWTYGKLVTDLTVSEDFRVTVLYVSNQFARKNTPNNDYDIIGNLSLLQNPVLQLTPEEVALCKNDLKQIESRMQHPEHAFYYELLGSLVVVFFLDLYHIHKRMYAESSASERNALLLRRFIDLLTSGAYKEHRDLAYYAAQLHITPKYLSEVCKKVSGQPASFWIDRFTITEITRLLKNKQLTLTHIANALNFSSISYFSRYVQRILGTSPTAYRQRLGYKDSE